MTALRHIKLEPLREQVALATAQGNPEVGVAILAHGFLMLLEQIEDAVVDQEQLDYERYMGEDL